MITDYEANRLCNLIEARNGGVQLNGNYFTYDAANCSIVSSSEENIYAGKKQSIDINERMIVKSLRRKAYEAHLQAYILQHIDEDPISTLLNIDNKSDLWIGNEVSCGVGMQSIDIMTQQLKDGSILINIIELKCIEPYESILKYQLRKYIDWVSDYIVPLFRSAQITIQPIIIAKKIESAENLADYINKCNNYSDKTIENVTVAGVKYIGYTIDKTILFEKLN